MPHLLWIMTGIILLSCLATYLLPAGQFATNEAGEIVGTEFQYLGHQTPVSPWDAMMLMGVTPYFAFFTRLVIMNFFLAVAIVMVMRYVKKIQKTPRHP